MLGTILALAVGISAMPTPQPNSAARVLEEASLALGAPNIKGEHVMRTKGKLTMNTHIHDYIQTTCATTGRVRHEESWQDGTKTFKQIIVYDGKNAWINFNGDTQDCTSEQITIIKRMCHHGKSINLINTKEDDSKLELLPEVEIDNSTMNVVKVISKDHDDITMYFDKQTKLLRRSTGKRIGPDGKKHPFVEDRIDYKKFDGQLRATKTTREIEEVGIFEDCITHVEYIDVSTVQLIFKKP